jgi:hypothetical protein
VYLVLLARARADLRPRLGLVPPVDLAAALALAPPLLLGLPSVVSVVVATLIFFGVLAALRQIPPEVSEAMRLSRFRRA